jgi:formylglycine-generating enzyme required for sulfatase activity
MTPWARVIVLAFGLTGSPALAAAAPPLHVRVPVPDATAPAKPKAERPQETRPVPAKPDKAVADEVPVPAGRYYVGRATGLLDYARLANASTPGFLVMRTLVTQALFKQVTDWGVQHGYTFEPLCAACDRHDPTKPVTSVTWRDAAVWANALSEMRGLDAVYRSPEGQPIRVSVPPDVIDRAVIEPTLSGYRIPTIPEWQIALRGADKAMADDTYGLRATDGVNALGLAGVAGPLAEWTATASNLDDTTHAHAHYACNRLQDGVPNLSACDLESAGFSDGLLGVRLVRKLPPASKVPAKP